MGKCSEGYSVKTKTSQPETKSEGNPDLRVIYDMHIATLRVIENQLVRLHESLEMSYGDDDVTQEQISALQEELVNLSQSFTKIHMDFASRNL